MNTKRQLLTAVVAVLLGIFATTAWAFETYSGCADCHGGFRADNYTSAQDGAAWGTSLMTGHVTFVGNECEACHRPTSSEVFLNSSANSTFSKSCVGCHGRDEDVTGNCTGLGGGVEVECGSGAGLRKHHESKVGANTCYGCHGDDPTPVGEDINPSYYGLAGIVMKDACDGDGTESQYGATGLDNDGNGQRDASDSKCETQANTPPTQPGTLSATMVTTSSATVQWAASTDADNDPISYKVEYRSNGGTTWSNGGTTSNTSQALSGLNAAQSYDVQVTPNDGTADGPSRTALNLFQTEPLGEIFPINAGLNGNWWNGSDRSGEGIQVEISAGDNGLDFIASFYSYDTMGNQIFMIMVGPVSGDTAEVNIYITTGGLWGDDFDPLLVVETQWGTGTIKAFSCESMEMNLRPNDAYKAEGYTDMLMYGLERLPGIIPVAPCPIANP